VVRGNDIRERSMGVCACIHQEGTYDDLCGARVMKIVALGEKIVVQGNDIHEHLVEVDICARVIGLREEIAVQESDIHEYLAEVDICVRQMGTYDDWCNVGGMMIDGHHEENRFVKTQLKSGTSDGLVG